MVEFQIPVFAKLTRKIERLRTEAENLSKQAERRRDAIVAGDWEAVTAASSGVANIYNGIEEILQNVAKDIDDSVPEGYQSHRDLLDQMSAAIPNTRAPVLSKELSQRLSELMSFCHLVRHRYGIDLVGTKVVENVDLALQTLPEFVEALLALDHALTVVPDDEPEPRPASSDAFKPG